MSPEKRKFLKNLRDFADWLEENTAMPAPELPGFIWAHPDTVIAASRALGSSKRVNSPDYNLISLEKEVAGFTLKVLFTMSEVCARKVVGTEHVEAVTIPAHEKEIVEWDCGSVLKQQEVARG